MVLWLILSSINGAPSSVRAGTPHMIGIKAVGFDPLTARKIHIISTVGSEALSTWVRGGERIFTTMSASAPPMSMPRYLAEVI